MTHTHDGYLPAAGHHMALPLYDPLAKLAGIDAGRASLIELAGIRDGERVLDVGCGTGTLAIMVQRRHPGARVLGIDPDPDVLARARRKAAKASAAIELERGFAQELPYDARSIDHVLSSLMFHHLDEDGKVGMLREVRRVLVPGGRLHLVDFDGSDHEHGLWGRLFSHHPRVRPNAGDRILALMSDAGFTDVRVVERRRTLLGRTSYYRGAAPR